MHAQSSKLLLATVAAAALVASATQVLAKEPKKTAADTMITVYVSAHGGSSMAKAINAAHVTMEAQGWRFADMEIHTENADTEGALVTYVK